MHLGMTGRFEIAAPEEYDVKRGKWSFAHLPVIPPHFDLAPLDKTKTRLNAIVRLVKPGGFRSVVAESVLMRHQLLILNRGRKRAQQ